MRQREYGVDLFRIMGLLFVNALHACLYNGFYSEAQQGGMMLIANSFRWLFFGCNAMFMLMTGYLKSGSTWGKGYYKSLVAVIVGYILTCVISYPIRYYWLDEKLPLENWVKMFFTFSNYAWYVEMYIGLFLLSPILNLAVNSIHDNKRLWLLVLTLVCITSLPAETKVKGPDGNYALIPDYWSGIYPITLYLIGAAIRKTKPKVPGWVGLTVAAAVAVGLGYNSLMTATKGFSSGYTQGYGGFWIMIMVTGLFLGVYNRKLPKPVGKTLAFFSGGVFEGYILSRLFDVWIYSPNSYKTWNGGILAPFGELVAQWHDPRYYWLIFLCITIPVFIISLTAGKVVNSISALITKGLYLAKDGIVSAFREVFSKDKVTEQE